MGVTSYSSGRRFRIVPFVSGSVAEQVIFGRGVQRPQGTNNAYFLCYVFSTCLPNAQARVHVRELQGILGVFRVRGVPEYRSGV